MLVIEFKGIKKIYPDGTEALKNISTFIPDNQLTAIIGPSGCGKTTLMKLINRLEKPTEGDVIVNGRNIAEENPTELRRSIGYVIQRIGLFPHMTIKDNIALVPTLKKWDKDKIEARVIELLNLIGLDPNAYLMKYPLELSGGQQQRIGVARALASEPDIILMDEPFSALDPISREQLQNELKTLQQKLHKTIVFVTHDMDEALKIADHIIVMKDGVIVQEATPEQLVLNPANDFVHEFIGSKRIEEKSNLKAQTIRALQAYMQEVKPDVPTISSEATIADTVEAFAIYNSEYLNVQQDNDFIGSIDRQSLLQYLVKAEVGA